MNGCKDYLYIFKLNGTDVFEGTDLATYFFCEVMMTREITQILSFYLIQNRPTKNETMAVIVYDEINKQDGILHNFH